MKYCEKTLDDIICELHKKMKVNEALTKIGYYIASELFIEILECVKYLHDQNPPLIHRDLKPANILLRISKNSRRIVKIADFGLTAFHEFTEQSHSIDKGTPKYMAPEIINGKKYDMKADIYSLGQIMKNLFDIDFDRY
jgi:serine/threonine protein kinase